MKIKTKKMKKIKKISVKKKITKIFLMKISFCKSMKMSC